MKKILLAAGLVIAATGVANAQSGPNLIETRRVGMALQAGAFSGMQAVVTAKGDVKRLAFPARSIARFAAILPTLFPAGTETGGSTRASPEIFAKPDEFKKAADGLGQAATALATAAGTGDTAAVEAALKVIENSCNSCHSTFRAR
jgi:cytochrome c556